MPKNEKTVLVTGCSSGFGSAISLLLKERGFRVFACVRKACDAKILQQRGFESLVLDLDSGPSIEKAVAELLERSSGVLDILVNNAGYSQIGAVEDLNRQVIRNQFETNCFGPIDLTIRLLPVLRRQKNARIVFISSMNARFAFPFMGAYSASKFALEGFADSLRRELSNSGVSVTLIEPGLFRTRSLENAREVFCANIDAEKSRYAAVYERIFTNLKTAGAKIDPNRSALVAQAVLRAVQAKRPPARIIVPQGSLMYEFAHRLLPDFLQDFLYSLKMKYCDKISL